MTKKQAGSKVSNNKHIEKKPDNKSETMKLSVQLDLNSNRYSPDNPLEIDKEKKVYDKRSIEENIVKCIKNIFRTPSNDGEIERFLKLKPAKKNVEKVFSILQIHGYNTTDEQFQLLRAYNYKSLKKELQLQYCVYLSYISNKKEEYSLSIKYLDEAMEIVEDDFYKQACVLIDKAIILSINKDPETIEICKRVLKLISEFSLDIEKFYVYRIWGDYCWKIANYSEALFQFDRAKESINKSNTKELIDFLAFLSNRIEIINPSQSLKYLEEIIEEFEKIPDILSEKKKADTYNQIVVISMRYNINNVKKDISYLEKAFKIYDILAGEAVSAAYVAGLLSVLYSKIRSKILSEKYRKIHEEYINEYGAEIDKYKKELALAFETNDLQKIKLLENASYKKENLKIYWYLVYMRHLMSKKLYVECIETGEYLLKNIPKNIENFEMALLCRIIAACYASQDKLFENVAYLKKASSYLRGDHTINWSLCHNSYILKDFNTAKEEAEKLINDNFQSTGPYIILSHIYFVDGKIVDAIYQLKKAEKLFSDDSVIKEHIQELNEINDGLLKVENSKFYKKDERNYSKEKEKLKVENKSEFEKFTEDIVDRVSRFIAAVRKTPPNYINPDKSMQESFFRDDFQRVISQSFHANAEIQIKEGNADLSIKSNDSEVIIEFKIWGRNDYKDTVNQLIRYTTDENVLGIIFMISTNKGNIVDKYREEIIMNNSSYISGTYRGKVLKNKNNINCLSSEHKMLNENKIRIFHFIFDCYS